MVQLSRVVLASAAPAIFLPGSNDQQQQAVVRVILSCLLECVWLTNVPPGSDVLRAYHQPGQG